VHKLHPPTHGINLIKLPDLTLWWDGLADHSSHPFRQFEAKPNDQRNAGRIEDHRIGYQMR
jgi:hypothetical protein